MSYFDQYGYMRNHKDIPVENGILFRARLEVYFAYWCSRFPPYPVDVPVKETIENAILGGGWDRYISNPPEVPQHFSRDNMYGLYILAFMFWPGIIKKLPLAKWNNRKGTDKLTIWWHPNGWMVFLALKYKWAANLLYLPILLMIKYSFWDLKRNPGDTSGACLWFDMIPILAKQSPLFDRLYRKMKRDCMKEINEVYTYYTTNGRTWENWDNPLLKLIRNEN